MPAEPFAPAPAVLARVGDFLTHTRREAVTTAHSAVVATGVAFSAALLAGVVGARFGRGAAAATYSFLTVGVGLWYAEENATAGTVLALSGATTGAAALLEWASLWLLAPLSASAVGGGGLYRPPSPPYPTNGRESGARVVRAAGL